jgi:membrane associated rhomboid family serine protease
VGNMAAVLIEDIAVLGASGAILGVLGYSLWNQFREVYMVTLLTVISGVFIPGVSNGAHFGGLVTGIAIGMMSRREYESDQIGELRTREIDSQESENSNESEES